MNRWILAVTLLIGIVLTPGASGAQQATGQEELRQVMDDFVRGWREGDAELLSRVLALDEGHITWVSREGSDERVHSMTFRDAVARNRPHPAYGREGWELESLDVVDEVLAVAKLRIPEGDAVNIDYMVCYRVAGRWRIVSNTFVIRQP